MANKEEAIENTSTESSRTSDTLVRQVLMTQDYDKFKLLKGNRALNENHVQQLAEAIAQTNLLHLSAIVVDPEYQVIDGQHRLEAARRLRVPIYYSISDTENINTVQVINARNRAWSRDDHLAYFCSMGNTDYLTYAEFKEKYKLAHLVVEMLLSDEVPGRRSADFAMGNFKVKNLKRAEKIAEQLVDWSHYYHGWNRFVFAKAISLLNLIPEYSHQEMISKVAIRPGDLLNCINTADYLRMLEGLYNYHRKGPMIRFY